MPHLHKPVPPRSGRLLGEKNKFTRSMKDAFDACFQDLQGDKKQAYHLVTWAKDNPTEFYKIVARLLPNRIEHTGDLIVELVQFKDA